MVVCCFWLLCDIRFQLLPAVTCSGQHTVVHHQFFVPVVMSRSHQGAGWTRAGAAPAFVTKSKEVDGAQPFDVHVVVRGKLCRGRWQFCGDQNLHYLVHADGQYVTPSSLCSRPSPHSNSSHAPASSDDDQSDVEDDDGGAVDFEVEDGADYEGPNWRYNFYFYRALVGSEEVVCDRSPVLSNLPIDDHGDVLVLNGVMYTGRMTGKAGTFDTDPCHDEFRFEHDDGDVTAAYSAGDEAKSDEDE